MMEGKEIAPDLRIRRITLSYKPTSSAMKLDSLFYHVSTNDRK